VEGQMETALSMHDVLLANAPEGASHDSELCPFCVDWSMAEGGTPSGLSRLELADAKTPYGDIEYADPGYQADKVKRYPIDTEVHAQAAWSYIHQAGNAEKYTADQLSSLRTKIQAALKKFGVEAENKEVEHTKKLSDAKAGPQKPKSSSTDSSASNPDPEVASEGGTTPMETIAVETHEALLEKALRDATASLEAEKAELAQQVADLTEAHTASDSELASLKSENERINGELDTAQVSLKAAQDEASELKADIASKEEAAAKAEVASERASQVRNLNLFPEDYVTTKAASWAEIDEAAWTDRLDEWKAAKGQTAPVGTTTDTASAMTGSNEVLTGGTASARRAALGLS
jgi:hypothetical protein